MRGGKRPGAGRPKGSPTKRRQEIADKALMSGLTPLEYLMEILRDRSQPEAMRFEAAKAAAPYMHPRLASVESKNTTELTVKGGVDAPQRAETPEEWLARRNRELQTLGATAGATARSH